MNSNSWTINSYSCSGFLSLLFLVFVVLTNTSLPERAYGETGYIEMFQAILIVSILIVGFARKSYLVNAYSRSTYWLRQSLFGLLFFEEISYLTADKFKFTDYNHQSELNLHNSHFLNNSFASFDFLGEDTIHLYPRLFIVAFVIVFLYAGDRIPILKRFSIISLHPYVRIGILLYLFSNQGPLNSAISYLIRNLFHLNGFNVVDGELIELFMYIVFMMDILIKSYPRLSDNASK
ncbi:hypothetical protein [Synechococcus sp. UW105]|uniref:hypothetical protein n=1 Tax=Synechococcus sp. UW105 TaxID=337067 RepID=UPI0010BD6DAE|nr:hypothetical protein [Synechococcus sp. UW105]